MNLSTLFSMIYTHTSHFLDLLFMVFLELPKSLLSLSLLRQFVEPLCEVYL